MKGRKTSLVLGGLLVAGLWVAFLTYQRSSRFIAAKVPNYTGEIKTGEREGVYHGQVAVVPEVILLETKIQVLGVASENEHKWIEVDLSDQKVMAWDNGSLFLISPVSTGLPWWPTPTGEFEIWVKLRATRMEGGEGKYYYNLPNVPYTMFFYNNEIPKWRGFSLHGAYWHNDFGTVHSHGCVNLPIPIAEQLYYWASPVVPEGKNMVYASADNLGTRVVIHD